MKKNVDVLNLEWTSTPSRDRQAATLVCNYIRYQGYSVSEKSIFKRYGSFLSTTPRLFFITNTIGAPENLEAMRFAKASGIKGLSLFSEGNFRPGDDFICGFQWGWNNEHVLAEDVTLYWSKRARDMAVEKYPYLAKRSAVCGGVGFDNYKLMQPVDRESFLKKYGKDSYKKVIGIGLWDFGFTDPRDSRYENNVKLYDPEQFAFFRKDRDRFNAEVIKLISSQPETLFLLKEHPGVLLGHWASGIEGAEKFNNVIILKSEESIVDCIDVSDLWIVYESTTALEAWLMGKKTALLNPSGTDFKRDDLFRGSVPFLSADALSSAIQSFYQTNILVGFDESDSIRKKIIADTIQWDDGLNHVRAGNEIIRLLECETKSAFARMHVPFNKLFWEKLYWFVGLFSFAPSFLCEHRRIWNDKQMKKYADEKMQAQISFYQSHGLTKADLRNIYVEPRITR
jgi:surface carbohydrate biosynthesis protein